MEGVGASPNSVFSWSHPEVMGGKRNISEEVALLVSKRNREEIADFWQQNID